MSNLALYVDVASKQLVQSARSIIGAQLPFFFQGDNIGVDLYFLATTGNSFAPYSYLLYSSPTIRLGLGKVAIPTSGTFTVTWSGQTTTALAYNISAAALQTALEALSNIGVGEAVVAGDYSAGFTITFSGALGGANQAQITASAANLSPDSVAVIKTTRAGAAGINEIQSLKFQQLAAAYTSTWTPKTVTATITPSSITNGNTTTVHETQRVTFGSPPAGGTFWLGFTEGNTSPIAYNASATDIASAINTVLGASAVAVTLIPGVSFDIIWADFVNHATCTANGTSLNWPYGFTGTLNLDTLGIDQMLAGAAQITDALLELELTPSGGNPETLLQQTVTVKNDMLENGVYGSTPTSGGSLTLTGNLILDSAVGKVIGKANGDYEAAWLQLDEAEDEVIGGIVSLNSGDSPLAYGGYVQVFGGDNAGGAIQIEGGDGKPASNASGGDVNLYAGNKDGSGTEGVVALYAGAGAGSSLIFSSTALILTNSKWVIPTSTPASAAAAGVAGTVTWNASFIYICTATNTWKRVAIATW